MGTTITLTADDGHQFTAYWAEPRGASKGALVIIQEIFGVNSHIRRVADEYAGDGYLAVAPALFDRAERGVELGYSPDDIARGRDIRARVGWDEALSDIRAAMKSVENSGSGKAGVIGYCWGGSLAWLTATRLNPACAVCYYGGAIVQFKDERPRCPVMMHFGERDQSIPIGAVAEIREAQPEALVFVYTAGHGFNCEQRKDYDAESAAVAKSRTLSFLDDICVSAGPQPVSRRGQRIQE